MELINKVVCIGDIHGNVSELMSLWKNIETTLGIESLSKSLVIFLGDYVDRGPNSKEVFESSVR